MTLNALYKELGKLIEGGCGRMQVAIDKTTFTHNLEGDGCVILNVCHVDWKPIIQMDGDGGHKIDSKGRECYRKTVVLYGDSYDPSPEALDKPAGERK